MRVNNLPRVVTQLRPDRESLLLHVHHFVHQVHIGPLSMANVHVQLYIILFHLPVGAQYKQSTLVLG